MKCTCTKNVHSIINQHYSMINCQTQQNWAIPFESGKKLYATEYWLISTTANTLVQVQTLY